MLEAKITRKKEKEKRRQSSLLKLQGEFDVTSNLLSVCLFERLIVFVCFVSCDSVFCCAFNGGSGGDGGGGGGGSGSGDG